MKNRINFIRVAALTAALSLPAVVAFAQPMGCNAHFSIHCSSANTTTVNFDSGMNPGGTVYAWDFGDGSTSSQNDPNHTYAQPGAYYACLTVTQSNQAGTVICTDSWCDSVHVMTPPPPPPVQCNAHFHVHRDMHSDTLEFSGGMNVPGTAYAWDFGDGSTGTGNPNDHAYAQPGTYYVCLTVTVSDTAGTVLCTATSCDSIHVSTPPPPPAPVCRARFFSHRMMNSDTIVFAGIMNAPGTVYSWDFGDGSTATGNVNQHLYAQPGNYYVCLTVTNTDSTGAVLCTATHCDSVHVGPPPPPPAPGCNAHYFWMRMVPTDTIIFAGGNNGPGTTYAWDFGDGSSGTGRVLDHVYAQQGTYYVCLTVTNTDSTGTVICSETDCDSVNTNGHFGGHLHHNFHHFSHMGENNNSSTMEQSFERIALTGTTADAGSLTATIYPNPVEVNSVIHIQNASGRVILRIYESDGRLVDEKEYYSVQDYRIAEKNLSKGIYFYQALDEENTVKGKFMIK